MGVWLRCELMVNFGFVKYSFCVTFIDLMWLVLNYVCWNVGDMILGVTVWFKVLRGGLGRLFV